MNTSQLLAKRADHKTSHILHLLLCIPTAGFWIPVWIMVALSHRSERGKIDRRLMNSQNTVRAVRSKTQAIQTLEKQGYVIVED